MSLSEGSKTLNSLPALLLKTRRLGAGRLKSMQNDILGVSKHAALKSLIDERNVVPVGKRPGSLNLVPSNTFRAYRAAWESLYERPITATCTFGCPEAIGACRYMSLINAS
jgi:hypothetical protein